MSCNRGRHFIKGVGSTDRDSMIYADGAGATIIEKSSEQGGILSHKTVTYTSEGEADLYFMVLQMIKLGIQNILKCTEEKFMNLP